MKLIYKKIERSPESSFLAARKTVPRLEEYWHYHSEYELVYILQGTGTFYVGNTMDHFTPGDLFLIGSNLPHIKRSEKIYDESRYSDQNVDLVLIQFAGDFLGKGFMDLPETKRIQSLLLRTARGIKFYLSGFSGLHEQLVGLPGEKGLPAVLNLLKILDHLASRDDYGYICSYGVNVTFRANEKMRMSKVINYLTKNYDQRITVEEIAEVANMAPNAFCRFFRNKTQKSFTEYLNEIRIGNACRLLMEGKMRVSEISYLSGFTSMSNFNRRFKESMDLTPTEFKRKYAMELDPVEY